MAAPPDAHPFLPPPQALGPLHPATTQKSSTLHRELKAHRAGGLGRGPRQCGGDNYLRRMISEAPLLYMRKLLSLFLSTVLMDLRTELKV